MAIDVSLLLRDGISALTATEATPTAKDFGGQDLVPLTYQVDVPSASGTTPTADVMIQGSHDNSTFYDIAPLPQITAAGQYIKEIITPFRYRRAKITVGGTTPNFGNVMISVHPAGRYDKK